MNVRPATEADERVLRELWQEFEAEVPEPPGFVADTWEEAWREIREHIASGVVLLAEDDEGPVGHAIVAAPDRGRAHVTDVHVRPRSVLFTRYGL